MGASWALIFACWRDVWTSPKWQELVGVQQPAWTANPIPEYTAWTDETRKTVAEFVDKVQSANGKDMQEKIFHCRGAANSAYISERNKFKDYVKHIMKQPDFTLATIVQDKLRECRVSLWDAIKGADDKVRDIFNAL